MRTFTQWLRSRSAFKLHGISPLHLAFFKPEDEQEYKDFFLRSSLFHIRIAFIFAVFLTIAYTFFDPLLYPDDISLSKANSVRFFILTPIVTFMLAITFTSLYRRNAQTIGAFVIVTFGIGCFLLSYQTNMAAVIDNYSSLIMTLIYAFFFTGLLFRYSFPAGLFICLLYVVAIESVNLPPVIATSLNTSMAAVFVLLALAAYQKEFVSRQLFVTETRERDALARQTQHDARYLEWLRSLARFLRHEVRQPVAQINSSIELIKILGDHNLQVSTVLDNAALSTQHVWNLIERASRATDVEAYVRQSQLVLTDLSDLLSDLVTVCQQGSSGLGFRFRGEPSIWVNADPILIEEAVRNLLSNAASYAYEHTSIEVMIARDGVHNAIITVRNHGPLAPEDTDALFGPFSSTRASPSSEHHGLGLYLVRLVAEQHGGRAELSNLADGTGVQASIWIPFSANNSSPRPNDNHGPARI